MENFFANFPCYGKLSTTISTLWKTAPVLAVVLLAGCGPAVPDRIDLPEGQDSAVTASLSANRIRIGDPVELRLTVVHRDGTAVTFPDPARGRDIIVREASEETRAFPPDWRRTVQTLQITSMTVTNHILAEGSEIVIATPEGLRWTHPYPFLSLEVVSSLAPDEFQPRPIKSALARWATARSNWVWLILALLATTAAVLGVFYKVLTTPRTILQMPPPVPPHQIALDALQALRAKGWIESLNIEPFYVELSAIVRRYLEDRFGLRAPERTTEEFMRDALASRTLSEAHRNLVGGFLEQSDLVKFARHAPGAGDMRNALASAERLVRETMPAAEDARSPSTIAGGTGAGMGNRPASPMTQGHGGREGAGGDA